MFASSSRRLPVFMVKVSRCVERAVTSGTTLSETSCSCGEADMDTSLSFRWLVVGFTVAFPSHSAGSQSGSHTGASGWGPAHIVVVQLATRGQ